jgi:hypothetical protein
MSPRLICSLALFAPFVVHTAFAATARTASASITVSAFVVSPCVISTASMSATAIASKVGIACPGTQALSVSLNRDGEPGLMLGTGTEPMVTVTF